MPKGKRGRLVRLLLMLAVVVGGTSVATTPEPASTTAEIVFAPLQWDWS